MLKKDKNDGYYFVSDKTSKRYELNEGFSINSEEERTSDIIYILDTGMTEAIYEKWINGECPHEVLDEKFVGFCYGANALYEEDYFDEQVGYIKEIVEKYESQQIYKFSKEGIENFKESIDDAACDELSKYSFDESKMAINITVGNHCISVPQTSDTYELLYAFLKESAECTVPLKTMDEMIFDSLYAYWRTNRESMTDAQRVDLEAQIEYMEQKIKEDK